MTHKQTQPLHNLLVERIPSTQQPFFIKPIMLEIFMHAFWSNTTTDHDRVGHYAASCAGLVHFHFGKPHQMRVNTSDRAQVGTPALHTFQTKPAITLAVFLPVSTTSSPLHRISLTIAHLFSEIDLSQYHRTRLLAA